jgi:hypothetical protein
MSGLCPSRTLAAPAPLRSALIGLVAVWLVVELSAAAQDATQPVAPGKPAAVEQPFSPEPGFTSLFDGRLLSGWEGKGEWFRVEDQAIVAGNLEKSIPHNQFLCTTRDYGDFELRLQVKTRGAGANGGIQIRSRRLEPGDEVSGYQADIGGVTDRLVWGGLYDESRRNRFLAEADSKRLAEIVKPEDWNDYVIRCVGPKVELFINGVRTVEYTEQDEAIPRTGLIGVQVHSGPPCEIWYRNLRIKTL